MYKAQDILIPSRFLIFILQVLLTITAGISRKDNILAGIDSNLTENSQEYSDANKEFLVALILFYVFEAIEMGIMLSGLTLFNNKLSIVQIFFHSVCVLLLCWFNHEQWEYWSMWTEWVIGGIVPVLLEVIGLMSITMVYRKVAKVT